MKHSSVRRPVAAVLALLLVFWNVPLVASAASSADAPAAEVLLKLRLSPEMARSSAAEGAKLVGDYGTFVVLELPAAQARALARTSPEAEVLEDGNKILLNTGAIETTTAEAQALRGGSPSFGGKRLHLVQFAGPIQPAWYAALVATGVQVVQPIPSNAYLVWGDAGALSALQSLSRSSSAVQWDGEYLAEYKLQPGAVTAAGKATSAPTGFFQVQLVKDAEANAATFARVDEERAGELRQRSEALGYVNFVVELSVAAAQALAERPDVVSIAAWTAPVKLDERQDVIMTGSVTGTPAVPTPMDYLSYLTGKGFSVGTAAGFAVNLTDSGIDNATTTPAHFGLYRVGDPTLAANSRVIYNRLQGTPNGGSTLQGCDGHGNLNAHIIGGYVPTGSVGGVNFGAAPHADASGFRWDLGLAPFVKVGSSVIFDPDNFTSPIYQNLESQAYRDSARISSNSWGSTSSNAYTVDAQQYDALVRDAQPDTGCVAPSCISTPGNQEHVIVFAAGNAGSGPNTVHSPSTGKNVITVGAAENVNPFGGADACGTDDSGANSANDIIGFSSRGPTSDGRRKPDIVAPGTHVSGAVAQASIVSPTGSGTGAQLACFVASGVCAGPGGSDFFPLGQQWYTASSGTSHSTPAVAGVAALIRQHFTNLALAAPSPAMTKALLMNSARYMNGVGANDTLPSNSQGMGEVSLNSYFDVFATAHSFHDQLPADTFTASGQQRIVTGSVADITKPLRVTLAWTDTPGPTSGNAFVNNLDLEVTAGGNTYKGNVFSGPASVTGGTADTRNNVESVIVPAGVSGTLVIKVRGINIAGDGIPNNGTPLDQDFALVAYNVVEAPLPVIAGGASVVTAESCSPPNAAVDPAETVTVSFELANIGTASTTSLVGTLQATGGITSPSGPQNYGALLSGGPAVARAFTFTATTSCGQPITATLQLQDGATNLGAVTFTLQTGALGAPVVATYGSGNVAVPLPDSGTADVPINVADTGVVTDVNVRVRLNHTFDGDVQLSLVSPTGVTVPLVTNRGSSGANFGTGGNDCSGTPTVLDDGAATAISAGAAPFSGSFRPEAPLAALNGLLVSGTWTLHAADTAAQDSGTIGCVQLEITRQRFACCGVAGTAQIVAGGPGALTAESFLPVNNAPDPGEIVTFDLPLLNSGDGNTANLVATLQSTPSVTPITTTQNYGVVVAAGPSVSRAFTFIPHGACGAPFNVTLHLQDGVVDLGNVTFGLQFGVTSTSTATFTSAAAITIPASGTGATTGAPATPYPSNVVVSGSVDPLSKVTVALNGLTHTFPDDVDVLLVGPTGRKMLVLSDSGGSTDVAGVNITVDDSAATASPDATILVSGSFKPANYDTVQDPFPAPAPAGPYLAPTPGGSETLTSAFVTGNPNPNGTWSLYVVDDAGTDIGTLAGGWSLTLTTAVPVCSTPVALQQFRVD